MKSYILPFVLATCVTATAQATTKPEIRAAFADSQEIAMLFGLQRALALPEKGDEWETSFFTSMQRKWREACEAKIRTTRAALAIASPTAADNEIWARSLILQEEACHPVNEFLESVTDHIAHHPGVTLQAVKNAALLMYNSQERGFLDGIKRPLLGMHLLSSAWQSGPFNDVYAPYMPFQVGQKITAINGTKVVASVVAGANTYDLLSLSSEQAKAALEVMALFPSKKIDLKDARELGGAKVTVSVEESGGALDTRTIFKWGVQTVMDVSLEKNEFYLTGLDILPLADPVLLVGASIGGNSCSGQQHFLMSMPVNGKPTMTPEFGACDDEIVSFKSQDRVYFKFSSGAGGPYVAVLQKQ